MDQDIYEFICAYLREHQMLPTYAIISQHFGISPSALGDNLRLLREQGKLSLHTCCPTNVSAILGYKRGPTMPLIATQRPRVRRKPKPAAI